MSQSAFHTDLGFIFLRLLHILWEASDQEALPLTHSRLHGLAQQIQQCVLKHTQTEEKNR